MAQWLQSGIRARSLDVVSDSLLIKLLCLLLIYFELTLWHINCQLVVFYGFIDLHRLSELQEFPIDLEPYVKKLMNSRRRVMLVNNILQNAQVLTEHKQINKRRGKILTFWIQLQFSPTDQSTIQLNLAGKKTRSDCPGQVNFALGQVKIEVQWPSGQEKLASMILWVWMKC